METELKKVGRVQVVHLRGRLDLDSTLAFEELLTSLVDGGERTILLECTDLRYVGSAGLGVFVAVHKQLGSEGKIAFSSLNQQVRGVFDLVRFGTLFEIFPTEQEALERLGGSAAAASGD
jgi:anti-anti-sigma factor